MPKKIDPEIKARAVSLMVSQQQEYPLVTAAAEAVANQLGLGQETVRRSAVEADVDVDAGRGTGSAAMN